MPTTQFNVNIYSASFTLLMTDQTFTQPKPIILRTLSNNATMPATQQGPNATDSTYTSLVRALRNPTIDLLHKSSTLSSMYYVERLTPKRFRSRIPMHTWTHSSNMATTRV
jgi:hypothetical protein